MVRSRKSYFGFLLDVENIDFFYLTFLIPVRETKKMREVGVLTRRKKKTSLFALRAAWISEAVDSPRAVMVGVALSCLMSW
jgi:hypothetical protein